LQKPLLARKEDQQLTTRNRPRKGVAQEPGSAGASYKSGHTHQVNLPTQQATTSQLTQRHKSPTHNNPTVTPVTTGNCALEFGNYTCEHF
jgi:hypothetical protein